jgi:peptidyl-prolyl cis-trans isomerase C
MTKVQNSMTKDLAQEPPELAYHLLRGAVERFSKAVPELDAEQLAEAKAQADKTYALESLVLSSDEARDVIIPQEKIEQAVAEIVGRYENHEEFLADMDANGLDEETLRSALYRELLFDAVMNRVGSRSAEINDVDVRIFYEMHKDKFAVPETRTTRHILITINPEFPENTREAALERINTLAERLQAKPKRFAQLARENSECPTAMQDGLLGDIKRGALYPELDAALFDMQEGDVSEVIESEVGLHILLCEKIKPEKATPRVKAEKKIRQHLEERARRACQKAWLEPLKEKSNDS